MEEIETCLKEDGMNGDDTGTTNTTSTNSTSTSTKIGLDHLSSLTLSLSPDDNNVSSTNIEIQPITTTANIEIRHHQRNDYHLQHHLQHQSPTSVMRASPGRGGSGGSGKDGGGGRKSSLIEETYRSIDVARMLTPSRTGTGNKGDRNSPSKSTSISPSKSTSKSPSKSTSKSPSKSTSRSTSKSTPTPSSPQNTDNLSTTTSTTTSTAQVETPKSPVKKEQTPTKVIKEEADILVDAFETMADIAVELFHPSSSNNNNDNHNNNDTDGSDSESESSKKISETKSNNNNNNNNNKKNNNNIPTEIGPLEDDDVDIPFDEQDHGLGPITPICSNRKSQSPRKISAIARMRNKQHNSSSSSSSRDKRTPEEIYKQRQKKWEKLKSKNRNSNGHGHNNNNSNSNSNSNNIMVDDCGIFGEMAKPITDVMYQSQLMLFEALVGTDMSMGNGHTHAHGRHGSSSIRRNDSFSSSDSSFGSDSYGDSDSSLSDFSEDLREKKHDRRKHHHNHNQSHSGNGSSNRDKDRERDRDTHSRSHRDRDDVKDGRKVHSSRTNSHTKEEAEDYDVDESEDDQHSESRNANAAKSSAGLKNFLDDITTEGIKLKWHKPIRSSAHATKTGIGVKVSIQISDSSNGEDSVEPNLAWEVLLDKKKMESRVRFQDVKSIRQRLSLFDISSVQKAADSMNLHSFPYAIPENSILITLHDGTIFFFEAEDEAEGKLVIHGLRWISARLVFNLLTGNRNVCSEMLPMSMHNFNSGSQILSSEVMLAVTDHLVDNSLKRLSKHSSARK